MNTDMNYTLEDFFKQGKAAQNSITSEDVDPEQLKMGIEVESEHTDNEKVAERIATDHLAEIPDYYSRLKKMEDEAKAEMSGGKGKGEKADITAEELINKLL